MKLFLAPIAAVGVGCGGILLGDAPAPPASDASAIVEAGFDASITPDAPEVDPKTVLVSGVQIVDFAVDDSWVYWTDFNDKAMKVSVQGGAPVTLAENQPEPEGIAVDATSVYWSNGGNQIPAHSAIMKIPIGGGTPVQLATCTSFCGAVAVDASHVYWVDGTHVMRADLDGASAQTIVNETDSPKRILVNGNTLFWSAGQDFKPNRVVRANLDGTSQTVIATEYGIFSLATEGAFVYYIGNIGSSGILERVSTSGGPVTTLAKGAGGGFAGPVAVDDTRVYFSWFGGDGFMAMPSAGGPAVHVTIKVDDDYESTNGIISHGPNLYWIGLSGGSQTSINVTPKPP